MRLLLLSNNFLLLASTARSDQRDCIFFSITDTRGIKCILIAEISALECIVVNGLEYGQLFSPGICSFRSRLFRRSRVRLYKRSNKRGNIGVAVRALFAYGFEDGPFPILRYLWIILLEGYRLLHQALGHESGRVRSLKRRLACEQFISNAT